MDLLDLLLHPVRLRITHAMSGGRIRSTAELCAALPDVPKTTVYRHVGLLVDGGVLEVAREQRVRGAVQRHLRLRGDRMSISPEAGAAMSLDEHRSGFAAGMAALLAEFNAYLDAPGTVPYADSIGYRQGTLWLDDGERAALVDELRAAFRARLANEPRPGRRAYLASTIFFPLAEPAGAERA